VHRVPHVRVLSAGGLKATAHGEKQPQLSKGQGAAKKQLNDGFQHQPQTIGTYATWSILGSDTFRRTGRLTTTPLTCTTSGCGRNGA
jgi:hypothetical protein